MTAIFDFASLLTLLLLLICSCAYVRDATLKQHPAKAPGQATSWLDEYKDDLRRLPFRLARIGERLSPWVAASCIAMAVHVLFIR